MSSLYFINKAKNQTDFKSKSFKLSNIASLGLMIPFKISPIKCHSEISRPYLGCSIRSTELGVGMVVIMVKSDSPAEIAGIRLKDVILEIEGKPINTIHDYNGAVGSEKGKKKVKIQRKVDNHEKILEMYVEFIK
jgi:S1-C subfamily serine protease